MDIDPPVVNKWDGSAVKNALDDATKSVMMNNIAPVECFRLIDGRLLLSGLAVSFSMAALVYDYLFPFPESRTVLCGCVAGYFLISCLLTYHTTCVEKSIFATVLETDPSGIDPSDSWSASSNVKKYDTFYNLTLRHRNGKSRKERESSAVLPIEKFFDTEGVLQYERLQRDVMKLHANIQAKME